MLKIIKNAAKWTLDHLPGERYIVFESVPDLSDNTRAVFDEMQRRGLQEKYKMYWWVKDKQAGHPRFPNTAYLDQKSRRNRMEFWWVTTRAKCLVSCNLFLPARLGSTTSFYLTHGTALKRLNSAHPQEGIHYTLVAAEMARELMARELRGDVDTYVALGYPRNDALQTADRDVKSLFSGEYRKIIVWYPTYRQRKDGHKTAAKNGLPVLHDTQKAVKLNEIARENGILLVVKPHFAQDVSYIKDHALSNICFIDDNFFVQHQLSSYEFVGSCDALITDYSSIYFDYLLCDKPAAVIWEDIDEYRENPGFAMDPDVYMRGSHKIYTLEDFQQFLQSVAREEDPYREERNQLNTLLNYAADGKNAQRVTDFIMEKANL